MLESGRYVSHTAIAVTRLMYAGQLGDDGLVWRTPVSRKRRETGIEMGKEEEKFSRRAGLEGEKAAVMSAEKETTGEGRQRGMRTRADERAGAKENGVEAKRTRCAGERQGAVNCVRRMSAKAFRS